MNIDWSKALDDATHAGNSPYEKGVVTWFKGIGDPSSRNHFMNAGSMNAWAISSENLSAWDLIERQKNQEAWDSEDLPPVGAKCEVDHGGGVFWDIVTIIAHHGEKAIYEDPHGNHKYLWGLAGNFRPIKTAEQVAEDERKSQLEVMHKIYMEGASEHKGGLAALYDAGYKLAK